MAAFGRAAARPTRADGSSMRVLRSVVVIVVAVIVQISLLSRITIVGVRPDLLMLLAIAAGVTGGAEFGAVMGFFSGMLFDLMMPGPAGISALTFSVVGYAVGSLQSTVMRATWWIPVLSALVATAAGETLYAVLRQVLGQSVQSWGHVPTIVAVTTLVNAVLALPFMRLAAWTAGGHRNGHGRVSLRGAR